MSQLAYRRVLLKLSGEALMGDEDYGIDPKVISRLAREVIEAQQAGAEIALVIGGGNIFRGAGLAAGGMDRVTGDQMGMLATVINALAMQDALEKLGAKCRVMSAIKINDVCEDYIRRRADAPPREGPHRDLRRRHRQSVLHHRLGRGAARDRDRRRPAAQGDQGRRRVRQGSEEARRRRALREAELRRSHRARPAGDGHRRLRPVPRQRPAAAHLRHGPAGRAAADPARREHRHAGAGPQPGL